MAPGTVKVTIRGIDPEAYRRVMARADREGRSVGEVLSTMICQSELVGDAFPKRGSLKDIKPEPWGQGTEHDSERVDEIVYGVPPRKGQASISRRAFKRPPPDRGSFVDDPLRILEASPSSKSTRVKGKPSKG